MGVSTLLVSVFDFCSFDKDARQLQGLASRTQSPLARWQAINSVASDDLAQRACGCRGCRGTAVRPRRASPRSARPGMVAGPPSGPRASTGLQGCDAPIRAGGVGGEPTWPLIMY